MAGPALFDAAGQLEHRALPHSVTEPVRPGGNQHRRHQAVLPIVIVRDPPERSLNPADHDRDLGVELLQNLRIDRHGIVRPRPRLSFRRVSVVMAEPLGRRIMVDHGIHGPGIDPEIQPRSPQFPEIPQVVPPVRLGHDSHPVAPFLEPAADDRRPERRMVDKGIARNENHINVIPSEREDLLHRGRKHVIIVHP